jgi:hypothetical protein
MALRVTQFRVGALARLGPVRALVAPRSLTYDGSAIAGADSILLTFWVNRTKESVNHFSYGPADNVTGGFTIRDQASLGPLTTWVSVAGASALGLDTYSSRADYQGWVPMAFWLDATHKQSRWYQNGIPCYHENVSWSSATIPFPPGQTFNIGFGVYSSVCHVAVWRNVNQAQAEAIIGRFIQGQSPQGIAPGPQFYAPLTQDQGTLRLADVIGGATPTDGPNSSGANSRAWGLIMPPNVSSYQATLTKSAFSSFKIDADWPVPQVTHATFQRSVNATTTASFHASAQAGTAPPSGFPVSAQSRIAFNAMGGPDVTSQSLVASIWPDHIADAFLTTGARAASSDTAAGNLPFPVRFYGGPLALPLYPGSLQCCAASFVTEIAPSYRGKDLVASLQYSLGYLNTPPTALKFRIEMCPATSLTPPSWGAGTAWTVETPWIPVPANPSGANPLQSAEATMLAQTGGIKLTAGQLAHVRITVVPKETLPATINNFVSVYNLSLYNRG